ncbi:unnamed protein product [Durusdinium trenchii]|uniref:Transmembrane protein n=1 Tax=Durusdinium trenchii TaxID=1381693 RepID=A0ABP0RP56_9DINO
MAITVGKQHSIHSGSSCSLSPGRNPSADGAEGVVPHERGQWSIMAVHSKQSLLRSSESSSCSEPKALRTMSNPMSKSASEDEQEQHAKVAAYVSRMEIVKPEVLRVTRAHQAFQGFARALRPSPGGDLYKKSQMSTEVSSFWSHSWHGGHWTKIFSLLMHYNGLPSVLLGLLAAVVMAILFGFGLLPGIVRFWSPEDMQWSTWSSCFGFLVSVLSFFLWRSQQRVFLDRICINEHDEDLKSASIFSLAGILKRSKEMLVLWDSTWSDRLWCVFELSAFLRAKQCPEASQQVLLITPTFLGPCSVALFVGAFMVCLPITTVSTTWISKKVITKAGFSSLHLSVTLPIGAAILLVITGGYVLMIAFRSYFRSVEELKEKLQKVSCRTARCSCCDSGHDIGGVNVLCDRKIVQECVTIWFGSQKDFEHCARTEVLEVLTRGLEEQLLTRGWSLSVTMPVLWAFLDLAASFAAFDFKNQALEFAIEGFVLWFLVAPIFIDFCIFLASRCLGRLFVKRFGSTDPRSFLLARLIIKPGGDVLVRAGLFASFWGVVALCHFLYRSKGQGFTKCPLSWWS